MEWRTECTNMSSGWSWLSPAFSAETKGPSLIWKTEGQMKEREKKLAQGRPRRSYCSLWPFSRSSGAGCLEVLSPRSQSRTMRRVGGGKKQWLALTEPHCVRGIDSFNPQTTSGDYYTNFRLYNKLLKSRDLFISLSNISPVPSTAPDT